MSAATLAISRGAAKLRVLLGMALGLTAAVLLQPLLDGGSTAGRGVERRDIVLSDCDGRLRTLVIHYLPEAADVVTPVYRDFLRQLPKEVRVHVVCPDAESFSELARHVAPVACDLSPVIVDHAITAWSRDRWLALSPVDSAAETPFANLLCPRGEKSAQIWPARAGDGQVAGDLAASLANVGVRRSDLFFEGGDFVADRDTIFVTPDVLLRNLQFTVPTRGGLVQRLSHMLGRRVVLLAEAPEHHAGMYMMPVGNRTMLVGDPSLAKQQLNDAPAEIIAGLCGPEGPDFTASTQDRFDAVARQCREEGYRVVRIPIVPGRDGRTYLTWLNGILDHRDGRRRIYMPFFDEAGDLNLAARQVWESLDYEVREVDCSTSYRHAGSLRCLVSVLRRG